MDKRDIPSTKPMTSSHSLNNTERDSLRFHTEVYLKEYEIVRREMEYRFDAQEKSFSYLISVVVGLFAVLQLFGSPTVAFQALAIPPFSYLIVASVLMFFPVSYVYHNTLIVLLGLYQYVVLAEKLDGIARELAQIEEPTRQFLEWETANFRGTPYGGTLRWDYFRLYNQFGTNKAVFMMGPLSIFRPMILVVTPLLLLVLFLQLKPLSAPDMWTTIDYFAMAALVFSVLVFLYGSWYVVKVQSKAKAIMEDHINHSLTNQSTAKV